MSNRRLAKWLTKSAIIAPSRKDAAVDAFRVNADSSCPFRDRQAFATKFDETAKGCRQTRFPNHGSGIASFGAKSSAQTLAATLAPAMPTDKIDSHAAPGRDRATYVCGKNTSLPAKLLFATQVSTERIPAMRAGNFAAVARMASLDVIPIRIAKFKIFRAIIVAVSIDVMDAFARFQFPPNQPLHYQTVVVFILVPHPAKRAAICGDVVIFPKPLPGTRLKAAAAVANIFSHARIVGFKEPDSTNKSTMG